MTQKITLKLSILSSLLSCILLLSSFSTYTENSKKVVYTIAPVILAAGITAASQGAQAFAQGKMNKKTREWNEKMYATQRKDALTDWQMQNAYNSPEEQMKRLQQAGLNPNLVYGDGNAGATSNSQVRSSDTGNWNPQTPDYAAIANSANSGILSYIDMKQKSAQTDNIKAQNQLLQEQIKSQNMDNIAKNLTYLLDTEAKNATNKGIAKTAIETAQQQLYNLKSEGDVKDKQAGVLNQTAIRTNKESFLLDKQSDTESLKQQIMKDDNARQWLMNASNLREARSRIVSMAVSNAKSQAEINYIMENAKSQEFENWFKEGDKDFYKTINTSRGFVPFLFKALDILFKK